jgi:hypothetical protein
VTLLDHAEADLLGECEAVVERVEDVALVQIRRVDHVPGGAELFGEVENAGRQPLRVMEQDQLGHGPTLTSRCDTYGSKQRVPV